MISMPSHETCSAVGNHEFSLEDTDWVEWPACRLYNCKCSEASMKEMTVSDGYWEYHDCGADICKGSEGGT